MKTNIVPKFILGFALLAIGGGAQAAYPDYEAAAAAAKIQLQNGDFAALEQTAKEELTLAKTPAQKADALLGLGLSYSQRKLYTQAREQWIKIIESTEFPLDTKRTAYNLMAASYGEENNWIAARAEFQKALALPGTTPQEKANLDYAIAITFLGEKNSIEGRKQLTTLAENTELETNFRAMIYAQLGQELINQWEFEQARGAFNQTLGFPNTPVEMRIGAQAGIAQSYKAQGDETNAQAMFVKAQREALVQMALSAQAKQYGAARALAEQALTLGIIAPTLDATLQTQIGDFLRREGKLDEARMRLEAFIAKQYPLNLSDSERATIFTLRQSTQLKIAKIYAEQGNKESARTILQALLATGIPYPAIQAEAEKVLRELT